MTNELPDLSAKKAILVLELREDCFPEFFPLLQSGIYLRTSSIGCSIRSFLSGQLALADDYIRQRISTIFLDGMPVDDPDTAVLRNGSRLALSSAMPGLVGATMRSGSPLASFRDSISYKASCSLTDREGFVFLKLFNLVMHDLCRMILNAGVIVPASVLEGFLREKSAVVGCCTRILLNGRELTPDRLSAGLTDADAAAIELTVLTPTKYDTAKEHSP